MKILWQHSPPKVVKIPESLLVLNSFLILSHLRKWLFIPSLYFLKLSTHQKVTPLNRVTPRSACLSGFMPIHSVSKEQRIAGKIKFKRGFVSFECKLHHQEKTYNHYKEMLSYLFFTEPETILTSVSQRSQARDLLESYSLELPRTSSPGVTGWKSAFLCSRVEGWRNQGPESMPEWSLSKTG